MANFIAALIAILIVIVTLGASWLITCGIIYLITLCFGFEFSWGIATGTWLIICLLRSIFNITVKK